MNLHRAQVFPAAILSQTSDWQGLGSPSEHAFTLSLWPIGLILPLSCYQGKVQSYLSAARFPQQKGGQGKRARRNGTVGNDRHFLKSYSCSCIWYYPTLLQGNKALIQIVYDKASSQIWQNNPYLLLSHYVYFVQFSKWLKPRQPKACLLLFTVQLSQSLYLKHTAKNCREHAALSLSRHACICLTVLCREGTLS